jgi:rhodanese-related sulfurtransferase
MMAAVITPAHVRHMLLTRQEIALIDLREEASFALEHPLFASQIAAGRIEIDVLDRIPRRDVTVVLYDDGEGLCGPVAAALAALDYNDVRLLVGGLKGWRAAGYELFQDVNSYCKAFGELVEARRHTPSLPAPEVQALINSDADIAIVDVRRFEEYATMNIPGSTSVPGAELVMRAQIVAPSPDTTIIVNCAGRTRSIIGTQSLVNAGLPNPVFALRNGTIGWTLAGQELEKDQSRRAPEVDKASIAAARERARQVSYRAGVRRITPEQLRLLEADATRTLYRFDVRTPEEYRAGHLTGFRNAPGGQLVQETDMVAPVRGARIVLADDLGPRAHMTGSWLAQMAWETYVLEGGFDGPLETGDWRAAMPRLPDVVYVEPAELEAMIVADKVVLVDLAPSPRHRAGHVPSARFAIRAQLANALAGFDWCGKSLVLTCGSSALAAFAAADLVLPVDIRVLNGGASGWVASGRALETGFSGPLTAPSDIYKRPYEGTDNAADKMQAYLDWEYGLVDQLERDQTHGFVVI